MRPLFLWSHFRLKKAFYKIFQSTNKKKKEKRQLSFKKKYYSDLGHNIAILLFFFTCVLQHEASETTDSIEKREKWKKKVGKHGR